MSLRHGVYLPPFGELADPRVLADLAAEAEQAGFDGVFVWDHVVRPHRPGLAVCDAWIALAAMALATRRVTIGPRVTPLSRRRPHDVARQAVALDQLSGARFVLGVGSGADTGGELSKLGEATEPRERARLLDEGLHVITALWSGDEVRHDGPRYRVDDLRFLPRPVRRPRIPIWVAARSVRGAPLRRAARYDGLCPEASPGELTEMLEVIAEYRADLTGYEVAVAVPPERDKEQEAYERAGATWWLRQLPEICTRAEAFALIDRGPY
ncbi:Luciferase-like monooxygenase [Nocardia amikacinitolerans]|uniref:Luciferase-like monooxygenase n=1 Tax=Nocardia amikacinitolerans TaxID=756689 RepID=A0A285L550_9NOCA|nr:LLM class flavin-dependent oxidoreductase [Nocardia amikacinitolerans]MCP2277747.1 Luciferase-like monooxygenase [Nocardia amikacinitolerans]MCP2297916.1 Luciferase-like monooxygenase [Nocardia amikacinitolerans]SNY80038.1 Luciferase-like monooxygenase [Nocardia amikacinitolerans]